MAQDRGRKRTTPDDARVDYLKLKQIGEVSSEQMGMLKPLFDELKKAIHREWAESPLDDGNRAKTLHFWIASVVKLEQILEKRVVAGKQATHKLEEINDGR